MSKPTDNVLLVPGESGWEIWTGQSTDAAFTLHTATSVERAADLAVRERDAVGEGNVAVIVPREGEPAAIVPQLELSSFQPIGFPGQVFRHPQA